MKFLFFLFLVYICCDFIALHYSRAGESTTDKDDSSKLDLLRRSLRKRPLGKIDLMKLDGSTKRNNFTNTFFPGTSKFRRRFSQSRHNMEALYKRISNILNQYYHILVIEDPKLEDIFNTEGAVDILKESVRDSLIWDPKKFKKLLGLSESDLVSIDPILFSPKCDSKREQSSDVCGTKRSIAGTKESRSSISTESDYKFQQKEDVSSFDENNENEDKSVNKEEHERDDIHEEDEFQDNVNIWKVKLSESSTNLDVTRYTTPNKQDEVKQIVLNLDSKENVPDYLGLMSMKSLKKKVKKKMGKSILVATMIILSAIFFFAHTRIALYTEYQDTSGYNYLTDSEAERIQDIALKQLKNNPKSILKKRDNSDTKMSFQENKTTFEDRGMEKKSKAFFIDEDIQTQRKKKVSFETVSHEDGTQKIHVQMKIIPSRTFIHEGSNKKKETLDIAAAMILIVGIFIALCAIFKGRKLIQRRKTMKQKKNKEESYKALVVSSTKEHTSR